MRCGPDVSRPRDNHRYVRGAAVTCRLHDTSAHCYNTQIGDTAFGGTMETKELESLDVLVVDDDAFLREICATLL